MGHAKRGALSRSIDKQCLSLYILFMIKSIRHKGLRRLFEDGNAKGVRADHLQRIEDILSVLAVAESVQELSLPSYRLHPLKGS